MPPVFLSYALTGEVATPFRHLKREADAISGQGRAASQGGHDKRKDDYNFFPVCQPVFI